jgi:Protein of unknown function (DUF4231)
MNSRLNRMDWGSVEYARKSTSMWHRSLGSPVCPHASNATERPESAILSLITGTPARGWAVCPGRPEVVRRRLKRSLLVARLWPDLTVPIRGPRGSGRRVDTMRSDTYAQRIEGGSAVAYVERAIEGATTEAGAPSLQQWDRRAGARRRSTLLDLDELHQAFAGLELENGAKRFLESVWLRYVDWWDHRARQARRRYFALRGIVLVGGAATPSLIGFSLGTGASVVEWVAWGTGLLVAIAAAFDSLLRPGDVWREKRAAGELLKIEGWRFFQLLGSYRGKSHKEAFPEFAETVERLIEHEIGEYLAAAVPRSKNGHDGDTEDSGSEQSQKPDTEDA